MASALAQAKFSELWSKINLEIETNHRDYWPRIKGFLSNAVSSASAAKAAPAALKVGSAVFSFFVRQLPGIGTIISGAGELAVRKGKDYWTERKMKDPSTSDAEYATASSEWWINKGMQAYVDAARKYEDAVKDYATVTVSNCTTYKEKLGKFLYARYRLRRLESYHAMMAAYQERVKSELAKATAEFDKYVKTAQQHGPDFFDKDMADWHFANCRESCMHPLRGDVGISRPFNVQGRPPPLPPRPPR
jgi:hypothetical protein